MTTATDFQLSFLGGKTPPLSRSTARRLFEHFLLRTDMVLFAGERTFRRALGAGMIPERKSPLVLDPSLEDEKVRLNQMSDDIRLFVVSSEFVSRIAISGKPREKVFYSSSDGLSGDSTAPQEKDIEAVIDELLLKMTGVKNLDEIVAQCDGLELFFALDLDMFPKRLKSMEVVDVVVNAVSAAAYPIKHKLSVKRPSEVDSRVVPYIPNPGHSSFPNAHRATAEALAEVLSKLTGENAAVKARLKKVAARIGENREWAGVHTKLDSTEGVTLGEAVGKWMCSKVGMVGYPAWTVLFTEAANEWVKGSP